MNCDLTWPRRFLALHGDLQDGVAVLGVDARRIDVFRQGDNAPEFAVEALLTVVRCLFVGRQTALHLVRPRD